MQSTSEDFKDLASLQTGIRVFCLAVLNRAAWHNSCFQEKIEEPIDVLEREDFVDVSSQPLTFQQASAAR